MRPTIVASAYVVSVTVLAGVGFVGHSPWVILLAALVTAPASIVALPCYYLIYGLLALVTGANPATSSGSETGTASGVVTSSDVMDATASWFTTTTHVLGILTFAVAAIVNVVLVRTYRPRKEG